MCDFFKEFVKRGIDDGRYYELIYTMLTHRLHRDGFPLGFALSEQDGFNDKVLAKLPSKINLKVIPFITITRIRIEDFAIPF